MNDDAADPPSFVDRFNTLPSARDLLDNWERTINDDSLIAGIGVSGSGAHEGIALGEQGSTLFIGGTSGSGKSELIRSIVAGLAINYSPKILNFAFLSSRPESSPRHILSDLPHTVMIEDGKRGTKAIAHEIRRRMSRHTDILSNTDHDPAALPRKKDPFLILVADEISNLDASSVESLQKIGIVGRSLGIRVIASSVKSSHSPTSELVRSADLTVAMRTLDEYESSFLIGEASAESIPISIKGRGYSYYGGTSTPFQASYVSQSNSELLKIIDAAFEQSNQQRPPSLPLEGEQRDSNKLETGLSPAEIEKELTSRSELSSVEAGEFARDIEPHLGAITRALQDGFYKSDPLAEGLIHRRVQAICEEQASPKPDGTLDLAVVGALVASLINAAAPFSSEESNEVQAEDFGKTIGEDPLLPGTPSAVLELNEQHGVEPFESAESFGWVPSISKSAEVVTVGTAVGTLVTHLLGITGLPGTLISLCCIVVAYAWRRIDNR